MQFLRNPANEQINADENITSLAQVKKEKPQAEKDHKVGPISCGLRAADRTMGRTRK